MLNPSTNTTNTSSVLQQGLNGIKASTRGMQEAATDLVRAGTVEQTSTTTMDIVEPSVEIIKQDHIFDASANVVKVADKMMGTMIDVMS